MNPLIADPSLGLRAYGGLAAAAVTAEQIKAFINTPGRTAAEVQSAAMAGHAAYATHHIHRVLVDQDTTLPTPTAKPIDPTAAATTLYGTGNAEISDAEIQAYIQRPGMTAEQVLAGALANRVSAAQIARAMAGHPDYTLEHINQSLAEQGIAPAESPADPLDFRAETLFGAGNPQISDDEILAYIDQSGRSEDQILNAALAHGVSLAQIAQAMDGHPAFTLANLQDAVGFKQDLSRLEVLMGEQSKLLQAIEGSPTLQATQQAMDALRAGLAQLEPQLAAARTKVDERIAQGQAQDAIAAQAENAAAALKAQFDPLQLERLHAQAAIDEQQTQINSAQAEVDRAQAALNAANQAIADAAGIHKKSRRHRARGVAQHAAQVAQSELSAAQQKFAGLQPGLAQVQANAAPTIQAAQAAQTQWEAAQKTANAERTKADAQLGAAQRAVQLEVALKQALSFDELKLIEAGQRKASQVQEQIDAGDLKGAEQKEALRGIEIDTIEAADLTQKIDAQASQDRLRESEGAQAAVPLQIQARGAQLIAHNLLGDAAKFDQANSEVGVQVTAAQSQFDAASQRLLAAKLALSQADFAVDWGQAKKDAAKSSKAVAAAQPALDAAQAEVEAAQSDFDATEAQLSSLRHLATPLGSATLEAAFAAGSAIQSAVTTANQANAALGWVQLAQARAQSSDQRLAVTQPGPIHTTRAEQIQPNELAVQAGGAQIFSVFLKDKAAHAREVYQRAQAQLTVSQDDFQKVADHAGALAPEADEARMALAGADLDAAFAFALTRAHLSPEQRSTAEADKAGFLQTWQAQEMAGRKTTRKQIHLLDDLAQFQRQDPVSQAARQRALDSAHALEQASQRAMDAGDTLQAHILVAGLLGQAVQDDQAQLQQATAAVADFSAQMADVAPLDSAGWRQAAEAWKAQAAQEGVLLAQVTATMDADAQVRAEISTKVEATYAEQVQLHSFAGAALKTCADRDEHIKELHEDRKLFDDAHKRAQKASFTKMILGAVISLVVTVASLGTLVELVPGIMTAAVGMGVAAGMTPVVAGAVATGAVMGVEVAAASAVSQGINVGLGLQDKFSLKDVALAGLTAGVTGGALGSSWGRTLQQTVLGGLKSTGVVSLLGKAAGDVAWGLTGAGANAAAQGAAVGMGLQDQFNWSQAAGMGFGVGLSFAAQPMYQRVVQALFKDATPGLVTTVLMRLTSGGWNSLTNFAGNVGAGAVTGTLQAPNAVTQYALAALDAGHARTGGVHLRVPGDGAVPSGGFGVASTPLRAPKNYYFADKIMLATAGQSDIPGVPYGRSSSTLEPLKPPATLSPELHGAVWGASSPVFGSDTPWHLTLGDVPAARGASPAPADHAFRANLSSTRRSVTDPATQYPPVPVNHSEFPLTEGFVRAADNIHAAFTKLAVGTTQWIGATARAASFNARGEHAIGVPGLHTMMGADGRPRTMVIPTPEMDFAAAAGQQILKGLDAVRQNPPDALTDLLASMGNTAATTLRQAGESMGRPAELINTTTALWENTFIPLGSAAATAGAGLGVARIALRAPQEVGINRLKLTNAHPPNPVVGLFPSDMNIPAHQFGAYGPITKIYSGGLHYPDGGNNADLMPHHHQFDRSITGVNSVKGDFVHRPIDPMAMNDISSRQLDTLHDELIFELAVGIKQASSNTNRKTIDYRLNTASLKLGAESFPELQRRFPGGSDGLLAAVVAEKHRRQELALNGPAIHDAALAKLSSHGLNALYDASSGSAFSELVQEHKVARPVLWRRLNAALAELGAENISHVTARYAHHTTSLTDTLQRLILQRVRLPIDPSAAPRTRAQHANLKHLWALRLLQQNMPARTVSLQVGIDEARVIEWARDAHANGSHGASNVRRGAPTKLSNEQLAEVRFALNQSPYDKGYQYATWSRNLLDRYIFETYGVSYSRTTLDELLSALSRPTSLTAEGVLMEPSRIATLGPKQFLVLEGLLGGETRLNLSRALRVDESTLTLYEQQAFIALQVKSLGALASSYPGGLRQLQLDMAELRRSDLAGSSGTKYRAPLSKNLRAYADVVFDAVNKLSPARRAQIREHLLGQKSDEEIATEYGIRSSALTKYRARLANALGGRLKDLPDLLNDTNVDATMARDRAELLRHLGSTEKLTPVEAATLARERIELLLTDPVAWRATYVEPRAHKLPAPQDRLRVTPGQGQ